MQNIKLVQLELGVNDTLGQIMEARQIVEKTWTMVNEMYHDHLATSVSEQAGGGVSCLKAVETHRASPSDTMLSARGMGPASAFGPSMLHSVPNSARGPLDSARGLVPPPFENKLLPDSSLTAASGQLATTIRASMSEVVDALEDKLKQSYTQQCEMWGTQVFQRVRGEFSAQAMNLTNAVDRHVKAMDLHADVMHTISDKLDRLHTGSDCKETKALSETAIPRSTWFNKAQGKRQQGLMSSPEVTAPLASARHTASAAQGDFMEKTTLSAESLIMVDNGGFDALSQKIDKLDNLMQNAVVSQMPPEDL
jgi:hypothetical protein